MTSSNGWEMYAKLSWSVPRQVVMNNVDQGVSTFECKPPPAVRSSILCSNDVGDVRTNVKVELLSPWL